MATVTDIMESNGGIISTASLSSRADYMRLRRAMMRGEIVQIRHGVYAEPAMMLNTMIDIEQIVPGGVVCLYNAWSFHQLTTTVPPGFSVAIEAKRKICIPPTLPINLYYWKKENFEFGVVVAEISGYKVRITDLERSVCDAVKYRNKIGMDLCIEIIKSYMARPDRNLSRLMDYAKRLRVAKILGNFIEIMME